MDKNVIIVKFEIKIIAVKIIGSHSKFDKIQSVFTIFMKSTFISIKLKIIFSIFVLIKSIESKLYQFQSIEKNTKMDLDVLDPSWELAEKHGIASLPGMPLDKGQVQSQFCSCCMNQVCKQDVPLCENSKTLQFLGYGFPLYFIFIKFSIILLFMLFITYTCIGIFWAYNNNWGFCNGIQQKFLPSGAQVECTGWMVMLSRIEMTVSNDQGIVRITAFVVQLFILIYMRDILRKTNQYYDQKEISPADFAILIQNLPKEIGIGQKVKQFLRNKDVFKKEYEVQSIIFISSLDSYFQLKKAMKSLVMELKSLMQQQSSNDENSSELILQIKSIEDQILRAKMAILQQQQKETQLMKKDEALCQKLILIINTEQQKQQIIQNFQSADQNILQNIFGQNSKQIVIKNAPEPKQILWENINRSKSQQVKKVIISWTLYSLILTVVTVVFFFLLSIKSQQVELTAHSNSSFEIGILVYGSLFSVLLFNKFILSHISRKLTDYQKQKTGGQLQFSFASKQMIGLFFTTALMTLIVEDIRFHNIYSHPYGVIEEETIMFFMSGVIAPLIWIINPWYIYRYLVKKYYYGSKLVTQEEANKMMELTHYSIGKRYAQIIQGLWFTFLYASLIPIGSLFSLFGLSMFYWIDKYNLLRKSSVLENVSSDICLQAMTFLDFTLVLKPIGQIIFDSQIRQNYYLSSIVCLVISVVYMLIPINSILDYFHSQRFDLADQTYSATKDRFLFDYKTLHPLKYCQQRDIKDSIMQQAENQFEGTNIIINGASKKLRMQNTLFKDQGYSIKSKHASVLSSLDPKELSECASSANCIVKGVRNLPPLREVKNTKLMPQIYI